MLPSLAVYGRGYRTIKETAERWDVSVRTVNMHLNAGRVPDAVRKKHGWLVPAEVQKPADYRRKQGEDNPRAGCTLWPLLLRR